MKIISPKIGKIYNQINIELNKYRDKNPRTIGIHYLIKRNNDQDSVALKNKYLDICFMNNIDELEKELLLIINNTNFISIFEITFLK